jgi:hypothetical protein
MKDDISHIAKDVLRTGELTQEHVSELAKLTAKRVYSLGYQAGEAADKKDVWNAAIEACVGRLKNEFIASEVVIEIIKKELKK